MSIEEKIKKMDNYLEKANEVLNDMKDLIQTGEKINNKMETVNQELKIGLKLGLFFTF